MFRTDKMTESKAISESVLLRIKKGIETMKMKQIILLKMIDRDVERAKRAEEILTNLFTQIEMIKSFEFGYSLDHQKYNCDLAVIIEMTGTMEDIKVYSNHPEHIKARHLLDDCRDAAYSLLFECTK